MIQTLLSGLAALAILVVIHEFGHLIFAKLFGVKVPVFSIGMGPRLFGFSFRGTDYRVSLLPVGGYVRIAGQDPFDEEYAQQTDQSVLFMNKPIWQRLVILFGGPGANLLLPVFVFAIAAFAGERVMGSTVGQVVHESPAEEMGFQSDDKIVEVNGQPVDVWSDFAWYIADDVTRTQQVVVERNQERVTLNVSENSIPVLAENTPLLKKFGLMHQRMRAQIGVDDPSSPAGRAGLRTGDVVVAVNGVPVTTWAEMVAEFSGGTPVQVDVKRAIRKDGFAPEIEEHTISLAPLDGWQPKADEFYNNAWGIAPAEVFVGRLMDGKPAALAGMKDNDRVYAVNGRVVKDFSQLSVLVASSVVGIKDDLDKMGGGGCFGGGVSSLEPDPLTVSVIREGKQIDLEFTPTLIGEPGLATTHWRPLMGIYSYPDAWAPGAFVTAEYSLPAALGRGVHYTAQTSQHILTSLGGLLTGGLRVKDSVGGPVRIFSVTAQAWEGGWLNYIRLLALISISLGIANLLPIPVLDGGQILIFLLEGIRGRPVSPALRERMQMIGVLFMVALFLVVTFFDIEACLTNS